jgi:CheY-like chemotaxis protein
MHHPTHILLIEDDPAVAQSLQVGLEREGYSVTWKDTGTAGIAHARDYNPHLIILDVRLPDGSGFDFRRRGRNAVAYPGSGLGLAIVKTIVGHHGGYIGVESAIGQGSRFSLTLPRML